MRMIVTLSTKLFTVDKLLMVLIAYEISDDDVPLPSFLRNFHRVKGAQVRTRNLSAIARTLQPDGESVPYLLPMLEEIKIHVS